MNSLEIFLDNNAKFSLAHFHEKLGDTEIELEEWMDAKCDSNFGRSRALRFRAKVKNPTMFTKSTTRVEVRQRYRAIFKSVDGVRTLAPCEGSKLCILSIDSASRAKDVPFCDSFHCEDGWLIEPVGNDVSRCKVSIRIGVKFSKTNYLRKLIESRAISESKEAFETWVKMAHEFLSAVPSPSKSSSVADNGRRVTNALPELVEVDGHPYRRFLIPVQMVIFILLCLIWWELRSIKKHMLEGGTCTVR